MANRTLKVIRESADVPDAVLLEVSLNESETAELEATYRRYNDGEGPEYLPVGEDDDVDPDDEGVVTDLVLKLSTEAVPDHFELYKAQDGWRFRRVAANGEIVADSGESYSRKTDARRQAEDQADGLDVVEV